MLRLDILLTFYALFMLIVGGAFFAALIGLYMKRRERIRYRQVFARGVALACMLVAVTGACQHDGSDVSVSHIAMTDSAGVRIVDMGSDLAALTSQIRDVNLVFNVGLEGTGLELFRVSGAKFLPNGTLAIGNSGVPEVLVIGPTGDLIERLGDRGEGPGQFGEITSVHPQGDGSIVVYDDRQARLTSFERSGAVQTRRMADANSISDLTPIMASQNGPVLAVLGDNRTFQQSGIRRDTTPVLRFSVESTVPDTVGHRPTRARSFVSVAAGSTRSLLPFGPDLFTSGNSERVLLAESHRPEVHVLDEDGGLLMLFRWSEPSRGVTEAEYREWQAVKEQELSDRLPEEMRQALIATPAYDSHPVLSGILLAQDGSIWIAPTSLSNGADQTWLRFSAEGEPLPAVRLNLEQKPVDAVGGRVAVLMTDEVDAEVVSVFELQGG